MPARGRVSWPHDVSDGGDARPRAGLGGVRERESGGVDDPVVTD